MGNAYARRTSGTSRQVARRRSLRSRLALLYGGLFLACGTALLAIADTLVLGLGSPSPANHRRTPHALRIGRLPLDPRTGADLHGVLVYSAIALAGLAVACFPLGRLMAGRALRPFRTTMAKARDISATNLQERLGLTGPYDEFVELGGTLDDLFSRLEASFESQRHFVANASHELRTPLTAERALLQVALSDPEPSVASLRATCEELLGIGAQQERLVDALLTLASSERGIEHWEPVDLAATVDKVVALRRHQAEQRSVHLDLALDPVTAAGDANLVESLAANLVDNALRHNVPGGRVEIATVLTDGRATFSVANTGPAIPPDEIDRLFQPFQRLARERGRDHEGHGLGLAIVAGIAKAHRAQLAARARTDGGMEVTVSFLPVRHDLPDTQAPGTRHRPPSIQATSSSRRSGRNGALTARPTRHTGSERPPPAAIRTAWPPSG